MVQFLGSCVSGELCIDVGCSSGEVRQGVVITVELTFDALLQHGGSSRFLIVKDFGTMVSGCRDEDGESHLRSGLE